ncbi:MAG: hypothetical protein HGA78_07905, partial [Nitrospirales bacterium]|nr:hypothetical protein [Nitrospirales bacterium]
MPDSELKRAEQELQIIEARLRSVIESTADGLLGVDSNGRVIIQNSRFFEMWSIPTELQADVDDNALLEFVLEQLSSPEAFLSKVRDLYGSQAEDMDEIHFKDGRVFERYSRPLMLKGECIGRVWSFRDITARKIAEQTLRDREELLRNSQKDIQKLAGRLISAQEEELRRLSRELHDDLTQRLAVLAIEVGKIEVDLRNKPESCPEIFQTIAHIKEQLVSVSQNVHDISRQLHPTILDDLGLVRAIEAECAALMKRETIEIIFSKENVPIEIDRDIALCLYRVLQESLKNVVTQSNAKNCEIYLKGSDDAICLTVKDNGIGFDNVAVRNKPGLGLSSMRERAQLVQGDFS